MIFVTVCAFLAGVTTLFLKETAPGKLPGYQ